MPANEKSQFGLWESSNAINDKITEKHPDRFFSDDLEQRPARSSKSSAERASTCGNQKPAKYTVGQIQRSRIEAGVATTSTFRTKQPTACSTEGIVNGLMHPFTLPVRHLVCVAFRDVTNRTNSRTVIAALVPLNTVLNNTCPYLILDSPSPKSEALYLGVLCSTCLDWYARRVVELHVNFYIFNNFPFPLVNMEGPSSDE